MSRLGVADEGRHEAGADPWWVETWIFDLWLPDGSLGAFTWLTLLPGRRRAWYWSVLAGARRPLLHVADLAIPLPARGLRVRTTGLWADHHCEAPFEQWTVQNECYAVALDDPNEALGRAYGTSTPIAMDIEWYASASAVAADEGYTQAGEVHAVIELASGVVSVEGRGAREHRWGRLTLPTTAPAATGWRAPIRLDGPSGPVGIERVLTPDGWETGSAP